MGGKGSGRISQGPDPRVLLEMKREQARESIRDLEEKMKVRNPGTYRHVMNLSGLMKNYKVLGETDKVCELARELIAFVNKNKEKIKSSSKQRANSIWYNYHQAYIALAPYSFHHYLVCMEWNYPPNMKFYANRICVLRDWAMQLERLEKGELGILGLSAPPRSGKTGIGSLFLSWVAGRHPDKSSAFFTHTGRMAKKAFEDVLNLMTDPRRGWKDIFPEFEIVKNAEYLWIDLKSQTSTNIYKTLYFTSIDTSKAGVMEISFLSYCDDLISGIEEALNPVRLDNAMVKYSTDIMQRRTGECKRELHIATRWSTRDPVSSIEARNEINPRARFIKVPGLNEDGESNFNFKYNPLTKEHFLLLKEYMDPVSFECIVQQNPIERDGLLFAEDSLLTYNGILPDGTPDEVVFACDVAFGGGDFLSMPVAYVYGMDAYIHDVVHADGPKEETRPLVVNAIIENSCSKGFFEANNGGDAYAEDVSKILREEGYRCHIDTRRVPTNKTKLNRILEVQSEIKGTITDGTGYRLHYLNKTAREGKPMYKMYMRHLTGFNQNLKFIGKQKDDAADATASLITNVLSGNRSGRMISLPAYLLAI